MRIRTFTTKLKELISKNKIKEALDLLNETLQNADSEHFNIALLISSRYHELKKRNMMGIISQSEYSSENSKIIYSLLELVESIPEEVLIHDRASNKSIDNIIIEGDGNILIQDIAGSTININTIENSKNYLESFNNEIISEDNYLHEIKVIFVGNGRVGKTTISKNLINLDYGIKDENSTHGLEIRRWVERIKDKKIDFVLNLWDFGGQGKYRAVQQFFCSQNTLYLYVTSGDDHERNKKDEYVDFEYWLPFINAFGYNESNNHSSPILHIRNKRDIKRIEIDETKYLTDYPNIIDFLSISCTKKDDLRQLKTAIIEALSKVNPEIFERKYSKGWLATKGHLEQLNRMYITKIEYLDIFKTYNKDSNESSADTLLKVLDSIGTVIHFSRTKIKSPEIENLDNLIVIQPDWVKEAAYSVLDCEEAISNFGEFTKDDFIKIWKSELFLKNDFIHLKELMLAFELCYSITKGGIKRYYVPNLFADDYFQNSNNTEIVDLPKIQFVIEFSPFMPAGILHKIIVKNHSYIYKEFKAKNKVILKWYEDSYVEIKELWREKKLQLTFFGMEYKALRELLLQNIGDLCEELKFTKQLSELSFSESVLCDCSLNSNRCSFKVKKIHNRISKNISMIDCLLEDGKQKNVKSLLKPKIQNQKRENNMVNVFISYSHKDEDFKNRLDVSLAALKRRNIIKVWEDRQIMGGADWNREIFDNLENSDIILLLISDYFIDSDFCYSKELKKAIENHKKGKCMIIPIIVRPSDFSDLEFAKFQAFPTDAKAINTWENQDLAWQNVIKGLKKSIKFIQEREQNS